MPLFKRIQYASFKNIFLKKAMIIASFLFYSSLTLAFNPFLLKKEFEQKLSAQQFLASTKFYALGPRFIANSIWSESDINSIFEKNKYRSRQPEQILSIGDIKQLNKQQCLNEFQITTEPVISSENIQCWYWVTFNDVKNLMILNNSKVVSTLSGEPFVDSAYSSLDPILIAQYKNNEPLFQEQKKISDIPVNCLNAVMAVEDNDFLEHSGISYTGLARAIVKNILAFRKAQGGSTITQQLVKNYFLTSEKSFTRKVKEIYMSIRLENQWTKDEILETYLNIIYMGQSGAFQVRGFPSASQYYLSKNISDADLHECALLAAIINNPGLNNPWKNKDKSLQRRNFVLKKMLDLNLIEDVQYNQAISKPLPILHELTVNETAPYYFEAVRNQSQKLGISTEGKSFYTFLDPELQAQAQNSLNQGINKVTQIKSKLKEKKEKGFQLEGAILSSDNTNGAVHVFVGGQNYRKTQYNRALNSRRQIGSLVKPFIYLAGLIHADFKPDTIIQDEPFTWMYDKKKWSPENYDKKFRGPVPYYFALKESLNSPTTQIAQKIELSKIIEVMKKAGFQSEIPELPSLSLGVSEHSPLEILQGFQTLARLGSFTPVTFISAIIDENNQKIYSSTDPHSNSTNTNTVFDQQKTATLVSMLKQTLQTGTAKSAAPLQFSSYAAGKTGTTSNGRDSWFAGFTANTTTVVWVGFDQNLPTQLTGATGALPIWIDYMTTTVPKDYSNDFKWPSTMKNQHYEFSEVHEKVNFMIE